MDNQFLRRAITSAVPFKKPDVKAKLKELEVQLKALETQKENSRVSKSYYTTLGKVEALRVIVSESKMELNLL